MNRLSIFALVTLVAASSLIAAGCCHASDRGYNDNRTCSIQPSTWADVPKGDWVGDPAGAAAFIASMVDGGCSIPNSYKPCANGTKCPSYWPMTTCPRDSLKAISTASKGQVQSFDGNWDKCTGKPPAGSTGITWPPSADRPAGGCHTAGCGE
jgi:hypothetical protein